MISVAVASQKGGVCKTTLTLNLAFALARRGWRTMVVDADPQGAIGLSLSKKVADATGLAEYVSGHVDFQGSVIQTKVPELALLPVGQVAPQDCMGFGNLLADGTRFQRLLAEAGEFDLVMVDTPSGFSGATMGALRAVGHVLAPVQAEPIALRSISQLLEVVSSVKDEGVAVDLLGFVIVMLQLREQTSLEVADELWAKLGDLVFQTNIPRDPAFLTASAAGVPLGLLGKRPPFVAATFDQLAHEVEQRLEIAPKEREDAPIPLVD